MGTDAVFAPTPTDELHSQYLKLLARYNNEETPAERIPVIAKEIEAVMLAAVEQGSYEALSQLACVYFGALICWHQRMTWLGTYNIPELHDPQKAREIIEKLDKSKFFHEVLGRFYATHAPDKLEELTCDGINANMLSLKVCFDRAKQIHDGNANADVEKSLVALNYLRPLFRSGRNPHDASDVLYMRNKGCDLLLDIAEKQGVLHKAYRQTLTHNQEATRQGQPNQTPAEQYQIVRELVFAADGLVPPMARMLGA